MIFLTFIVIRYSILPSLGVDVKIYRSNDFNGIISECLKHNTNIIKENNSHIICLKLYATLPFYSKFIYRLMKRIEYKKGNIPRVSINNLVLYINFNEKLFDLEECRYGSRLENKLGDKESRKGKKHFIYYKVKGIFLFPGEHYEHILVKVRSKKNLNISKIYKRDEIDEIMRDNILFYVVGYTDKYSYGPIVFYYE